MRENFKNSILLENLDDDTKKKDLRSIEHNPN